MPRILQLTPEAHEDIVREVKRRAPEGPVRDAHEMRLLYGRKVWPSRRAWIENFVQIEDGLSGQLVPLKFNYVQRCIEAERTRCERKGEPVRFVILKSRHHGVSTQFIAYGQEEVCRNETDAFFRAGIVAQEDDTAKELLENGKLMRANFPWKLPTRYDNRSALWYDDPIKGYVQILSAAKNKHLGRGRHFRFLHLTEVAFWPYPEDQYISLAQTMPREPGTVLTIESTANGAGGWFHDFFWDAWNGRNGFKAMFFGWTLDPRLWIPLAHPEEGKEILADLDDEEEVLLKRFEVSPEQLKWRRHAIQNECGGSLDKFHQEYPSTPREAFISSGRPVFVPNLVRSIGKYVEDPIWEGDVVIPPESVKTAKHGEIPFRLVERKGGPLKLWSEPQDGITYCAGSDVGEGIEQDDSCLEIAEIRSGCQVAEYVSDVVRPMDFGLVCMAVCQHFNRAWWLCEVDHPGNATVQVAVDKGYERVLRQPVFGRAGKIVELRLGWRTREESKRQLMALVSDDLFHEERFIASQDLIDQLLAYQINEKNEYGAPKGGKDDRVMGWALCRMARKLTFEQGIERTDHETVVVESRIQRHWREWSESTQEEWDEEEAWEEAPETIPWMV